MELIAREWSLGIFEQGEDEFAVFSSPGDAAKFVAR
jgi:hypothetical protein